MRPARLRHCAITLVAACIASSVAAKEPFTPRDFFDIEVAADVDISRDGNRLKARIGTDYSSHADEKSYDQIVVNYGTRPLDELYFDLREASVNRGEITQAELLAGKPQTIVTNPEGSFRLFRIGDAVSSRNIHAAIYDALRLMKDI